MGESIKLDREFSFLVGTYTDLDALAHQPYAPTSGLSLIHISEPTRPY